VLNVLFLCTGNSARSILAEVILNELGGDVFKAYSAGSHPAGHVNPGALQKLAAEGHPVQGLSSDSWERYSGEGAPEFDVVVTVCDHAAGESCPVWNGSPVVAHWGIADPAAFENADKQRIAFDVAYDQLRRRIEAFLRLPHKPRSHEEATSLLQQIHKEESRHESI
jgi:arsenate reductase